MNYISILSTLVTAYFTYAVIERYRAKGGVHLLLWGIGLLFYGIGTFTEVVLSFTYSGLALRLWYLSGAMLTAAWLGQGTVHLLIRKRNVAMALSGVLVIVSLGAFILVMLAPLASVVGTYDVRAPISEQYKEIITRNSLVIALTIILNIYGTLALVGARSIQHSCSGVNGSY